MSDWITAYSSMGNKHINLRQVESYRVVDGEDSPYSPPPRGLVWCEFDMASGRNIIWPVLEQDLPHSQGETSDTPTMLDWWISGCKFDDAQPYENLEYKHINLQWVESYRPNNPDDPEVAFEMYSRYIFRMFNGEEFNVEVAVHKLPHKRAKMVETVQRLHQRNRANAAIRALQEGQEANEGSSEPPPESPPESPPARPVGQWGAIRDAIPPQGRDLYEAAARWVRSRMQRK